MENLNWFSNPKILPDLKDDIAGSSQMQNDQRSSMQNMPIPDTSTKDTTKQVGINHLVHQHKNTANSTHQYSLHCQMPVTYTM